MKWKTPPKIKIYEALGSLADNRLKEIDEEIRVYSSAGKKFYVVSYDEKQNAIMTNDNGSYWVGYLGYPSIAYLMYIGRLSFNKEYAAALKGVNWKEINTKNKNDFDKTISEVDKIISKKINIDNFYAYIEGLISEIDEKNFNILGKKQKPPHD